MVRVDLGYSFPVGVRFHPTDEELLTHYLKLKTLGSDSDVRAIPVVDICKWEPWDLRDIFRRHFSTISPNLSEIQRNDHRWYFFCPRDGNSRIKRTTNAGFWKPTGTDRMIKSGDSIGTKKTLVFYKGRVPTSQRTNWVIHEYQLHPEKAFVLCLLKEKSDGNARGEGEPSSVNGTDLSQITTAPPNNSPHPNHVASGAENHVVEESPTELSPEDQAFLRHVLHNEPTYTYQQPQMDPEQGPSAMDFQNPNGFSNNYLMTITRVDTTESDDDDDDDDDDEEEEEEEEEEEFFKWEPYVVNPDDDDDEDENDGDDEEDFFKWEPYVVNPGDEHSWAERSILFPVEFAEFLTNTMESDDGGGDGDNDNEDFNCESYNVDPYDENTCEEKSPLLRVEFTKKESNPDEYTTEESSRRSIMAFRRIEMPESHVDGMPSVYSLTKEHVKDIASISNTDTDVLQSQNDPIMHIGMLQAGSSNSLQYRKENICFLGDESEGSTGSSVDSIADKPSIEINCIEFTSPEFPVNNTRTSRPQHRRRYHNSVAQRTPRKIRVLGLRKEPARGRVRESSCIMEEREGRPDSVKASTTATKHHQKDNSIVVSNNDLEMAGGGNTKPSLKSREQEESSDRNQKGSINFLEPPLVSSHQSSPPYCSDVKDSESSSETDSEVVVHQSWIDPILETFRSLNINSHSGVSQGQSSNSQRYRRENIGVTENIGVCHDESGRSSASSADSIADNPPVISCLQLASPKFPINNTTFRNSFAQRTASRKVCVQEVLHKEPFQGSVRESNCITEKQKGKPDSVKERTTATKLPQKDDSIVVSNNDLGIAGGDGTKLNLMPRGRKESGGI